MQKNFIKKLINSNLIKFYRTFNLEDQKEFAKLSGDFNPIHISSVDARLTIAGECVCHGINIFLWGIESLTRLNLNKYSKFKIKFINFIPINKQIEYVFDKKNNSISILFNNSISAKISLLDTKIKEEKEEKIGLNIEYDFLTENYKKVPEIKNQSEIKSSSFLKPSYFGNSKFAEKLFPYLSNHYGIGRLCEMASLSEVVGMRVPGMYSIFSSTTIEITNNKVDTFIKILDSSIKFKRVLVSYKYSSIEGQIEAFFRPKPFQAKSCESLKKLFRNYSQDYKNKNVLIIGGSRGLGACVAKLIAIRGGSITISYNKGVKEAKLLKKEIQNIGCKCSILEFDVFSKSYEINLNSEFDQLFYFASPKIKINKRTEIDENLSKTYKFFYIDAFRKLLKEANLCKTKKIFYPSTIYINQKPKGFKEYIEAKFYGEKLCEYENSINKNISILYPRLPKFLTDQTASIISPKTADIYRTMMDYIDEMNY